jgi:SAM-dependent methyltransferase
MARRSDVFLASLLILFLELACIRWFPAHVLFLTYFTNTVLFAAFLGMSAGCLAAGRPRDGLAWSGVLLALSMAAAQAIARWWTIPRGLAVAVEEKVPDVVFFGAEAPRADLARFVIPIEWVAGFFFLLLALVFFGLGQRLGRALRGVPPIEGYLVNVLGSLAGIALFSAISWVEAGPVWWFLPVVAGMGWLMRGGQRASGPAPMVWVRRLAPLALVVVLADPRAFGPRPPGGSERYWSPYYCIDYQPAPKRKVFVNLINHQEMVSRDSPLPWYDLPYLLRRDAGTVAPADVLVIGAGSGNDVSRALEWGAARVDAVEIDPVIVRLGRRDHPDRPYQDGRVTVHVNDGRNYLRSTERRYDLIVYALVDSLVLHSGLSNIRLESYLFTREALQDVQRCLKPGGQFVAYNYYRQGWIVTRMHGQLAEVFGAPPLVMTLPPRDLIRPDEMFWAFTVLVAGDTASIRRAFREHEAYQLQPALAGPAAPSGFGSAGAAAAAVAVRPVHMTPPAEPLPDATDDWPFLYLRRPMVPGLTLRGIGVMALGAALILVPLILRRGAGPPVSFDPQMFLLGAGFMLLEARAVVNMALLFGSTWTVNAVVFGAVLLTILAASLFVWKVRPVRLVPYYAGLLASLALNAAVPLHVFLGGQALRTATACLFVFAPVLFAGIVFGAAFARVRDPEQALGANIAGALLGGFAENLSLLIGFRQLALLALAVYALSALRWRQAAPGNVEAQAPEGVDTPRSLPVS